MARLHRAWRSVLLHLTNVPWTTGVLLERAGWRLEGASLVQSSDHHAARLAGEG